METRYLEVEGSKLAYDDTGEGPLVVCMPGIGDLRSGYRYLTPALVWAGYRVVSLDMRGLGESSPGWNDYSVAAVRGDFLAMLRYLEAGPATLIGSSMSAGAAAWAAAEAPEQVSSLVLIDPSIQGSLSRTQKLIVSTLFARPWGPAAWQKYHASLFPTRKPEDFPAYSAALRANLSAPGRMEAFTQLMLASQEEAGQQLGKVSAPTLVVMGSKDSDFKDPEAEARRVAGLVHGSYRMVPEAGHYPQAEMPEVTVPLILEFIQKTIPVHEPAGAV